MAEPTLANAATPAKMVLNPPDSAGIIIGAAGAGANFGADAEAGLAAAEVDGVDAFAPPAIEEVGGLAAAGTGDFPSLI